MKPEDLKNPDGFKSTQRVEEQSSTPAANEQMKNEAPAANIPEDDQNVIHGFTAENVENKPDAEGSKSSDAGSANNSEETKNSPASVPPAPDADKKDIDDGNA